MHIGPNIVEDGLVLYLDAGNQKSYPGSGTTWNDLSGNGNHGTLINGPTFDSANAGSIVFDGVDDYISYPVYSHRSTSTVDVWFKIANLPSTLRDYIPIAGYDHNITANFTRSMTGMIAYYSDSIHFSVGSRTTSYREVSAGNVNLDTPVNIQAIKNTQTGVIAVYRNGTFIGSNTFDALTYGFWFTPMIDLNILNNFSLGFFNHNRGDSSTHGNINTFSCKLYNRALTPEEILQNYNATKGRYGL